MFDFLKNVDYTARLSRTEQKEIDRLFARYFRTEDGQKILAYLQYITFNRAAGLNASEEQLRYNEGQRGLVAQIIRMVERGRHGA